MNGLRNFPLPQISEFSSEKLLDDLFILDNTFRNEIEKGNLLRDYEKAIQDIIKELKKRIKGVAILKAKPENKDKIIKNVIEELVEKYNKVDAKWDDCEGKSLTIPEYVRLDVQKYNRLFYLLGYNSKGEPSVARNIELLTRTRATQLIFPGFGKTAKQKK